MTDTITERGKGTYRKSRDARYIKYETDEAKVMIKAEPERVMVRRGGDTGSQMCYELGKWTDFSYKTPYGEMKMSIFTESMNISDYAIRLVYILDTGIDKIRNNMVIEIKG